VPALALVAAAKRWQVAEELRHTDLAGLPVLATAAPFKAGGRGGPGFYTDVPAGPLLARHVADLYPFPNTISAVLVTGDLVAGWLERAAAAFLQLTPGIADQPLLNPDFPTSSFDMIFGLTYTLDLSRPPRYSARGDEIDPAARRVTQLCHQGRPVRPEDRFVIATNSYRASGGARFPGAAPDRIVFSAPLRNRAILERYIAIRGRLEAAPLQAPVWRFAPMPGTSAIFETAPGARPRPGDPAGLRMEPLGLGPDGFARFRIRL
jgi:2',3'-cyclic-nucleotide 2'-phosphodiesterase/3'-nucleotidase